MQNRHKARENVFTLVFESKFDRNRQAAEVYETAVAQRGIDDDAYTRTVFFGVMEKQDNLDKLIEKYSSEWKANRISPVSLSCMEIAVYEMLYRDDIPAVVSLDEALELVKEYDDEGARAFVNGVLNAVMKECVNNQNA